jgi:hypothetical protein
MDDLQFDKAVFSNKAGIGPCVNCGARILSTYWHANGQPVCQNCATKLQNAQKAPSHSLLLRGAVYAFGAAIACSIAYASILIVTNYELALISIAVGWLIGKAARQGTGGLGGRPVQIVAVAATYIAISSSLFFQVLYTLFKEDREASHWTGYPLLLLYSFGRPFLELREGLGAILGIAILFFGLQQAWQQTGNATVTLAGPYSPEATKTT